MGEGKYGDSIRISNRKYTKEEKKIRGRNPVQKNTEEIVNVNTNANMNRREDDLL